MHTRIRFAELSEFPFECKHSNKNSPCSPLSPSKAHPPRVCKDTCEPVHVHVSKGKPTANSTKIWLTKAGGCVLADNASKIPQSALNKLMEFICAQFFFICAQWQEFFLTSEIKFFC